MTKSKTSLLISSLVTRHSSFPSLSPPIEPQANHPRNQILVLNPDVLRCRGKFFTRCNLRVRICLEEIHIAILRETEVQPRISVQFQNTIYALTRSRDERLQLRRQPRRWLRNDSHLCLILQIVLDLRSRNTWCICREVLEHQFPHG